LKAFYFNLLSVIIIFCLGIIVYSNTFFCSFHFDDFDYIVRNLFIRNIQNLFHYWIFYPCRFITFFSIAVNYHFNHLNVFGYHLFNLAVHLASSILVWWLTLLTLSTPVMKGNKITKHADMIALFAGLVFVSHPLQTEAVTYIWQRTASMAAMFYLASLCCYVKSRLFICRGGACLLPYEYTGGHNRRGLSPASHGDCPLLQDRPYYIASLILAVVAMFTKENTVTLPLMILLYEFCFFNVVREETSSSPTFNWLYVAPFLLTIFVIPVTILLTKAQQFQAIQRFVHEPGGTSPWHYLLTQFRVIVTYIRLLFLPLNQNLDYDFSISKSIFAWPVLMSFSFLAGILYWAKQLFSRYRLVSFSICWFFLTLSLESSVFPLKNVIFEHRLYLPLVGYSMFLVSGVYYLFSKNTIKTMVIILTLIVSFNSILTYQRNKVWKDEITLWSDALGKSPHNARPINNRGLGYSNQGNFTQAMFDYNKAIEIDPKFTDAYINRGNIYFQAGKFNLALSEYNKVIEVDPNNPDAYYNRGNVYYQQGNFAQAIYNYNKAIEININYAQAYNNRANLYAQEGKFTYALSDYNRAIEIVASYAEAYTNRGVLYSQQGNFTQALSDYNKAIEINPNFAEAYYHRGNADKEQNNFTQALSDYTKAIEAKSNYADAYYNRANTYSQEGDFYQAIADYTKAIQIDPNLREVYNNRAVVYYSLKKYDMARVDVHKAEELGVAVNPEFIRLLSQSPS